MQNYGITLHGKHAIINLRVSLTNHQRDNMVDLFPELIFTVSAKGYTLIKGCIPNSSHQTFWHSLQLAKLSTKADKAAEELRNYEYFLQYGEHISEEDIELPF